MSSPANGDAQKRREGDNEPLTPRILAEAAPAVTAAVVTFSLIFGGCCSNVYALEAIVKHEPGSGTLLTFVQFLFIAVTGYVAQLDRTRPPFFLSPNKVPLRRWLISIVLFFSINVLNNHVFSYDISVPVHIILRSGGSITTMIAGHLYGKKYSRLQAIAVVLLSMGVVLAAWSNAQDKAPLPGESTLSTWNAGLVILFTAQVLSAIMGLYTEATYQQYGPQWKENLFYSHILSLPLFLPFAPSMWRTFSNMARTEKLKLQVPWSANMAQIEIPSQFVYLVINVLTQYACIRGVNLLAATSSALTVTIVLNIRKLVSLLLSIWLFGNSLAGGTMLGAIIVFGAGALYSFGTNAKEQTAKSQAAKPQATPKVGKNL
ncbi:uncharacterized protein UV8b_04896 [Ustilaginoidea virens]|uniref:UDP-N-acetylglucosamine transporter YEA4 n=1 Tax=Ustilaginoidea virens TaxID=1159556 RepID=A0A8E5HSP4_USTVR|nr:uncharacterized protein UV8b_04896 [Ustilaginoidea virens]QUC20655.1 hypothetical protein UV8b_04896 [Ustilaginoidea virens]